MKWFLWVLIAILVPLQGLISVQALPSELYFSPNPDFFSPLLSLIHQEKELIQIATSRLTDSQIQQALMQASRHGVAIEIILDTKTPSTSKLMQKLFRENSRIWIYPETRVKKTSRTIMNYKFCICKSQGTVWSASCPFSPNSKFHCEHALIIREVRLVNQFAEEFEKLKQKSILLEKSSVNN